MKRKITALALAVALIAIAVVGGTLAYFADTDSAINVLTSGNVEILLHEDNDDGVLDEEYREWLEGQDFHPGVTLEKDVWVENTGSNPAYIRLFIAFPYNAKDIMTLNWDDLAANGWTDDVIGYAALGTHDEINDDSALDGDGYYTTKIGDEEFIVRCLTLKDPLPAGEKTEDTLTSTTMIPETEWKNKGGEIVYYNPNAIYDNTESDFPETYYLEYASEDGQIPVYICAQAVQVTKNENEDFTVYEAFNAAFGEYDIAWWVAGHTVTGNEDITGAVVATGTAVTIDENISVSITNATIDADQLAVFNSDAWMSIKDTTVECDKGIYIKTPTSNSTIMLDNVEFNVEDGPIIASDGGGHQVCVLSPIVINGKEYDFSTEMTEKYFQDVVVYRYY